MDKFCKKCQQSKPIGEFYERTPDKKWKSTHRSCCKSCDSKENRRKSDRKRDYHKNWKLMNKFGITLEQYNQLLAAQYGKCAICGRIPEDDAMKHSLAVDHDHRSGKVRGLLCRHCNIGLGKLGDSIDGLRRAISYLEKSEGD